MIGVKRVGKNITVSPEVKLKYIKMIMNEEMTVVEATRSIYGQNISKKELATKRTYIYSWVLNYKKHGKIRGNQYGLNKNSGNNKLLISMWQSLDKVNARHIQRNIKIKSHNDVLKAFGIAAPRIKRGIVNKIKRNTGEPIYKILLFFNFPKSSYYAMTEKATKTKKYNAELVELVEQIYKESNGTYGRNRIKKSLEMDFNINVGVKVVQGVMNQLKIKSIIRTPKIQREKRKYIQINDLIKRDWKGDKPSHKLFNDVTYISLGNKFAYLAATIDGFNNEIVGWSLSITNDQTNIVKSLKNPVVNSNSKEIIVHTDHASVYFSDKVRQLFKENDVKHSMGRIGVSLDNRPIEYLFSIIRQECINRIEKKRISFDELKKILQKFIYIYNNTRRQSGLDYMSPVEWRKEILR